MSKLSVKRRLRDFGELAPAEQKLLDEIDTGQVVVIGDGSLPPRRGFENRRIRASFLRYLILGGSEDMVAQVHEKGVRLAGAHILGDGPYGSETRSLDLEGCELARDLGLFECRFTDPLLLRNAQLQTLNLHGSHFPRLSADRLETRGDVLQRGAEVDGEVRLVGARVGGNLSCAGAKLRNAKGRALTADGARITGGLFLRDGAVIEGDCDLTAARLGDFNDDPDCWPGDGKLALNRCEYGAFTGAGVDAETRIRWLAKQDPARFEHDFGPQPWEQCAKVFREMGHAADARAVLIDKERRQRQARRARMVAFWRRVYAVSDGLVWVTVGYGRQPLRAFAWLGGLWLVGLVLYFAAWQADAFKPNNAFVLRAPEWVLCSVEAPRGVFLPSLQKIGRGRAAEGQSQLDCFVGQPQPEARSFPNFNAGIYSLDVLFPLVEVAQQAHWVPDPETWPGWAAKTYHYVQIILGWALSLLAVAGFSGLVKTD